MKKMLGLAAVCLLAMFGAFAAQGTSDAKATQPVDENGCTASETYSGPFSAQLGVTGCVGNGTQVTFCHATSSETNPFITLTTAIAAAVGQAGHFYENGTTQAGHEEDYVGPCTVDPPPPVMVDVCDPESGDIISVPEEDADQYLPADDPACAPTEPEDVQVCDPVTGEIISVPAEDAGNFPGVDDPACDDSTPDNPPDNPTPDNPPTVTPDAPPVTTSGEVPFTL